MMLSRISMESLLKIGALGGVACYVIATAYKVQVTTKVRNAPYFKDAMSLLNGHKAADVLLGKPINSGYIDVFSRKNFADRNEVKLFVPLKGSKAKGELFLSAVKLEDAWLINQVELEIKDNFGGKVLIYGSIKEQIA